MAFATIQPSFAAGELSPTLYARVDLDKYHSGAALLRNFFVDYRGGASNRPGTQYIDTLASTDIPHVIPFTVATTAAYVLVFLTHSLQIYSNGALIATIPSPYAGIDFSTIKYVQSADVLTLTHPAYPVYNLTQTGPTSFSLDQDIIGPKTLPPTSPSAVRSVTTNTNNVYGYQVTAVSSDGKEESPPTAPFFTAGADTNADPSQRTTIKWTAPAATQVSYYKIYKVPPFTNRSVSGAVAMPAPSIYGLIGLSTSTSFSDTNYSPDFSQTPPQFQDPFSPGQVATVGFVSAAATTGYTTVWIAPLVFTPVGSDPGMGAAGYAIIDPVANKPFTCVLTNPGKNYLVPPTVTDTLGDAIYTCTLGQLTGTYPFTVTYFQQRRVFGGTTNFPETFVCSQPGYYDNFDTSPISLASDSITASIASRQDNSIKSMVQMPTGLIIFTTGGGFLVSGGNSQAAITPSDVVAFQQASSGANDVPPLVVNYDVLYVQNRGATVRDLAFNFYVQSYTGTDRSVLASHLFLGYTILDWTYAEEPFRLIHAIRNDGTMLVFTYLPEQNVFAWSHYDTNGKFLSVTSIPEGQENAVYTVVQRRIGALYVYYLERFASRVFQQVEDTWFLDSALALPQTMPGAALTLTGAAAVIGATITVSASTAVFSAPQVGDTLWAGGGKAVVTEFDDAQTLLATVQQPFPLTPDDPFLNPAGPYAAGEWSIDTPVSTVSGLEHLTGLMVAMIADGIPQPPQRCIGGAVHLPAGVTATKVVAGLPYQCQLQTLKLDTGDPTIQGKRKNIPAVTWRVDKTLGIRTGPDFSTLVDVKSPNPGRVFPQPLISDDLRTIVQSVWTVNGQFCIEQNNPLPCSLLGYIPEVVPGDTGR